MNLTSLDVRVVRRKGFDACLYNFVYEKSRKQQDEILKYMLEHKETFVNFVCRLEDAMHSTYAYLTYSEKMFYELRSFLKKRKFRRYCY